MKVRVIALIAALLTVVSSSAQARHQTRHYRHHAHHVRFTRVVSLPSHIVCDLHGCSDRVGPSAVHAQNYQTAYSVPAAPRGYYYDGKMVGGRHAGDPYAFCGAEAARYVFGSAIRELWPAANWIAKFPRAPAAPGMAAARSHHVMILISQVSGTDWLVHDGNAGAHRTWEHVRSIRGYIIVDPHGARVAAR